MKVLVFNCRKVLEINCRKLLDFACFLQRIDGSSKKRPTHKEMVQYLLETYPETREIVKVFIDKLHSETIDEILDIYSDIVEYEKLELVKRFLKRKIEILGELQGGVR